MKKNPAAPALTAEQTKTLLSALQTRFEKNPRRHPGLDWAAVKARLARKAVP